MSYCKIIRGAGHPQKPEVEIDTIEEECESPKSIDRVVE